MTVASATDRCVRAMTNDGGFRLVAVTLRDTVTEAAAAQGIVAPASAALAELMVGSVLLRETTQPSRRVQIALRDMRGGKLVADALPDGLTRGLVNPGTEPESMARDARIEVTYTLPNGALHKGIVALDDESNISAAIMTYLQESEQILTTIAVAAAPRAGVVDAVGFVVQLLPELERPQLETMTERLGTLEALAKRLERDVPSPTELIESIFDGFEHTILAESDIRFGCNCSEERILAGLATLEEAELASMRDEGKTLDIRCDACGKTYSIDPAAL